MPAKRHTKRETRNAARARRKLIGRIGLIGLMVLIAVGIVWAILSAVLPEGNPTSEPTDVPTDVPIDVPTEGGSMPELIGTKQYSSAPPMLIDVDKQYFADVVLAKGGEFVIELYPSAAPITVNSFVFLAREGYFDGVTFHRVIEGFMAQGGDPTGSGSGGPGYSFVNEISNLTFDREGVVAMANSGQDTNGSQFFIMFGAGGLSASDYTIFGQVIEGMDVVNGIRFRNPQNSPTYIGDAIESITIREE